MIKLFQNHQLPHELVSIWVWTGLSKSKRLNTVNLVRSPFKNHRLQTRGYPYPNKQDLAGYRLFCLQAKVFEPLRTPQVLHGICLFYDTSNLDGTLAKWTLDQRPKPDRNRLLLSWSFFLLPQENLFRELIVQLMLDKPTLYHDSILDLSFLVRLLYWSPNEHFWNHIDSNKHCLYCNRNLNYSELVQAHDHSHVLPLPVHPNDSMPSLYFYSRKQDSKDPICFV